MIGLIKLRTSQICALLGTSVIKFIEFLSDYLKIVTPYLSPLTVQRYSSSFNALRRFFGDNINLTEITTERLADFQKWRLDQGMSPATTNIDLRHIKVCLNYAFDMGYLNSRVMIQHLLIPVGKLVPYLSPYQFHLINTTEKNECFRRFWEFILWSGEYPNVALKLRWEDVDLKKPTPVIRYVQKSKTEVIPIIPQMLPIMGPPKENGLIFPFRHPSTIFSHFRATTQKCGLGKFHIQSLKRSFVKWMESKNVNPQLLKIITNHTVPQEKCFHQFLAEKAREYQKECLLSPPEDNDDNHTIISN
ncbi:MAG: site-specific integrase [Deltaproteobacteria bacterium]|nr:site-specific integrase [Deltaproteobacteria bacterium]